MQGSENSSVEYTSLPPSTSTPYANFLDHWAWKLYSYFFASLFGLFALIDIIVIVQQSTFHSLSRSTHARFSTVQLFLASTLKSACLLWSPTFINSESKEVITGVLLLDCISVGLNLSAFSILLLVLLETTQTSLTIPRLQNLGVLIAITGAFSTVMLLLNLMALWKHSLEWYFASYLYVFVWGILVCVGYTVAGYRMWRNLKSSRSQGNEIKESRLKRIISLTFISPFITAAILLLSVFMAACDYGVLVGLEVSEHSIWARFVALVLLRTCELVIMLIIFGMVIRTKFQRSKEDNAPTLQLGTFDNE